MTEIIESAYDIVLTEFMDKVDMIVKDYLDVHAGKDYHKVSGDKVINDPIWGCVNYYSWEIKIIDTPLFQRLRDIYQVGLGVFTYPSARHSRFEHSLGVVAIASRMIGSLKGQTSVNIEEIDVHEVRLAALLHDIGHCFYSHLSESFYGDLPEFIALKRYFNSKYKVMPKPHEIFSYIIINTPSFISFLDSNNVIPQKLVENCNGLETLMKRIGKMIIGVSNKGRHTGQDKNKYYSFLTQIINGDIDADKLDYIKRDSYTSGLPLTFDTERLLYKISVRENEDHSDYQMVIDMAGITAVEEITFSKLMLNNYIYHHQKVLATETMAKDIALGLSLLGDIGHASDFLKYTDKSVESLVNDTRKPFAEFGCENNLGYCVKRVKDRYLPKRCFEINSRVLEPDVSEPQKEEAEKEKIRQCLTIIEKLDDQDEKEAILESFAADLFEFTNTDKSGLAEYKKFISEFKKMPYLEYTKNIRKSISENILKIYDELKMELPKQGISPFDVHITIPKTIDEQMTFSTRIVYRNSEDKPPTDMLSYTKNWAQAFNSNKWSGYVFVSPHIDVTIAFKATIRTLNYYIKGVKFNNPECFVKRLDEEILERIDSN